MDNCVVVGADAWSATVNFPDADCAADFDGSTAVATPDLLRLLAAWGPCKEACCFEDLDASGEVDVVDKAGEGIRTLDIHVGNVTLYH